MSGFVSVALAASLETGNIDNLVGVDNHSNNFSPNIELRIDKSPTISSITRFNLNSPNCAIFESENIATTSGRKCPKDLETSFHQIGTNDQFSDSSNRSSIQSTARKIALSLPILYTGSSANSTTKDFVSGLGDEGFTANGADSVHNSNYRGITQVIQDSSGENLTCVTWLRIHIPDLPWGDAKDLITNSPFPRLGSAVKLRYKNSYHLGQVVEVVETGIWIDDYDYIPNAETHRFISFDSGLIEGYWSSIE